MKVNNEETHRFGDDHPVRDLLLDGNDSAGVGRHTHGRKIPRVDGFERVLHLIEPSLW